MPVDPQVFPASLSVGDFFFGHRSAQADALGLRHWLRVLQKKHVLERPAAKPPKEECLDRIYKKNNEQNCNMQLIHFWIFIIISIYFNILHIINIIIKCHPMWNSSSPKLFNAKATSQDGTCPAGKSKFSTLKLMSELRPVESEWFRLARCHDRMPFCAMTIR